MTNQEWLLTLKPNECALFCLNYLPRIGSMWSVSRYGIATWLEHEFVGEEVDCFIKEFNEIIRLEKLINQNEVKGE